MIPEEFRQTFISHKKDPSANCCNLVFELRNYLEELVNGLVSKLDDSDSARHNVRVINKSSYNIEGESYNLNKGNKSQIKCFKCDGEGHVASQCNNGNNGQINNFSQQSSQNYRSQYSQIQKESNCTILSKSKNNSKMSRIIDINGEKIQILINTGRGISLMSWERYGKIGLPRLFSDNVSLDGIGEEVVRSGEYFPYEFSIDGFPISANFYVLQSLTYDIVLGNNVISGFNLAINKAGI